MRGVFFTGRSARHRAAPCKVPVSQHLSVGSVGRSFHPWTRQMDLLLDIGTIAACRPLYRCRHLRVLSPVWANVFWFRRRLIAAARDAKYGTLVTATEAPILTTPIALSGERLARFRRCCRFRSFHLAFWLLLSFARAALVHLKPFGHSVAAVSERPDPPVCGDGPGLVSNPPPGQVVTTNLLAHWKMARPWRHRHRNSTAPSRT